MVKKFQTTCCAMCIFSATNDTPIEELEAAVERVKKESKKEWHYADRASGERAIQIIVTPTEPNLRTNVEKLGFQKITQINRRNGYPPIGMLDLYILSW